MVDWTNKNYQFGFISAWTPLEHCKTTEDEEKETWGPNFNSTIPGDLNITKPGRKMRYESTGYKLPTINWFGNLDEPDEYDDLLKKREDKEPFELDYEDWSRSAPVYFE